jgi:hypothetical protein
MTTHPRYRCYDLLRRDTKIYMTYISEHLFVMIRDTALINLLLLLLSCYIIIIILLYHLMMLLLLCLSVAIAYFSLPLFMLNFHIFIIFSYRPAFTRHAEPMPCAHIIIIDTILLLMYAARH